MSSPTSTASRARASRSCGNCRAVKRRCDKQSPQCGQCIRTHEQCQGYRDEWELVFRDQTKHTIKRSKKKLEKNASAVSSSTEITPSPPQSPPSRVLNPSLEEIGVNYFFQDFVAGGRAPTRGYLNYIPTKYCADSEHPTLMASMAAVGLVALATQKPELARHARAKYSEAIRHVNDAIASPTESIKDSTLMSVISLGVFENVTNFESWVRHVKGAVALVIARGKSQFSSRVGILMFNQVRADLCAACIQTIQPFPAAMTALQEEGTKYIDSTDAFWAPGILAARCTNLYADASAKNHGVHLSRSWFELLGEALALQESYETVLDTMALQEPYITIQESKGNPSFASFRGRYDIYRTSWAIRLWNNSRMVEIIVCEIVCWLINKIIISNPNDPTLDMVKMKSQLQYAAQIMSQRGEEILASIPHGLGLVRAPGQLEEEHQSVNVSGGYMLTWNIYTVGRSPVLTVDDRRWVIEQLKGIRNRAGIDIALQLAEEVGRINPEVHAK